MDLREHPQTSEPSSQPQHVDLKPDDYDPLFDISRLFSGASLAWIPFYINDLPIDHGPSTGQLIITDLNDDCDLTLFDQFSLQKQLPLRAVCRQWNALIEQKCSRKRSLKLFQTLDDVAWYCSDLGDCKLYENKQFKLKSIGRDDELIGTLKQFHNCAHLFANIESFVFYGVSSEEELNKLPEIFPRLTSLTLGSPAFANLSFIGLNSFEHLTRLHLFGLPDEAAIPDKISILSQLEDFSLCDYEGEHTLSLISQLGQNLKRLMLQFVNLVPLQFKTFLTAQPDLAGNLTAFSFVYSNFLTDEESVDLLDMICNKCSNLTYLDLDLAFIDLNSFKSLTKLRHLVDLRLSGFWLFPDEISLHLPQQTSVKNLTILFDADVPSVPFNLQLVFPRVEEITIEAIDDALLQKYRQYMALVQYTCPVTFRNLDFSSFMGRHLKPYLDEEDEAEFAGIKELFAQADD